MLSSVARKRLYAIEKFSMLGAGFQIALRDLEIRGAGNLLGAEQSGHIAAVGYEMYCQMLDKAVRELREGEGEEYEEAMIDFGSSGRLSTAYIAAESRRLAIYQRLAECGGQSEIMQVVKDLKSGYGELPAAAQQLIAYHELRIAASMIGISRITIDEGDVVIQTKSLDLLQDRFDGASGTLRTINASAASNFSVAYFRPNNAAEQSSLLKILHAQLVLTSVSSSK